MTTTHTRTKFAIAVGAAIAGAVAPALLLLGAGTAQAVQDSEEIGFQDSEERPGDEITNMGPGSTDGIGNPDVLPPMDETSRAGDPHLHKHFVIYG